jgi:hypothetical protein
MNENPVVDQQAELEQIIYVTAAGGVGEIP